MHERGPSSEHAPMPPQTGAASAALPQAPLVRDESHARSWWTLRRRRFIVNGPHQLRAVFWVAALSTLFLAALDITLYKLQQARTEQMVAIAPELSRLFAEQDKGLMSTVYLGSFIALLAVVTVTLFETHRTAGPLYGLRRGMERLGKEGPAVRVRFRKEDHFPELEATFNEMARALHDRGQARALDAHRLSQDMREIAGRVMTPLPDVRVVSEALRQLAERTEDLEKDLRRG
jgi:methyl-accepting chemotaxis protein